jgi:hypothetical protein
MKSAKEPMEAIIKSLMAVFFGVGLFVCGCAKKQTPVWESLKNPETVKQLKQFVAEKEAQANAAAKADGKRIAPQFRPFFSAAKKGDWLTVSNMFQNLMPRTGQVDSPSHPPDLLDLRGTQLQALKEIWGAFDAFSEGDEKYSAAFGNDIIDSIPPGSIYFGGTDPGRFVITAMCKSHINADPFFTLTQNALADGSYLDYLRSMYGGKIYIPTADDSANCFRDYTEDVAQLQQKNQLKPGENVTKDSNGRMQVSGQVAVMGINALLAKVIFDKNTNREFYIEESYPFDWMYPYIEPHGLIFKINRQPLSELPEEIVRQDHENWAKYVQPMIGDWLSDNGTVEDVADFARKTFLHQNFSGFNCDPRFIQNTYEHITFSKLRSSIAGLYAWRMNHFANASEKERMMREADFAFRQAFALCPYSPENVYWYVNFLLSQNRLSDALLIAEVATEMPQRLRIDGGQLNKLVEQLKQYQKEQLQKAK